MQPLLQAADEAFARGDLLSARQLMDQALEAAPDQLPLLLTLGSLEFQLGEFERAFALFSRVTDLHPKNATAHVQLAACALKIGRLDRFEAALNQALELEPTHIEALRMLANFQMDHRHFDSAARVYFMILKRDPDDREALLSIAVCFRETGDNSTARLVLERLLSLDPSHALARKELVSSPFPMEHARWGWRSNDYFKVWGLLQAQTEYAVAMDSDLLVVSDQFRTLLPITRHFGLCVPMNPRQLVKHDGVNGVDAEDYHPGEDPSGGNGMAMNSVPMSFWTNHAQARSLLETLLSLFLQKPARLPLNLWRSAWRTGFHP